MGQAAGGFSRGFFGCFGVLAAIVVGIVVIAALGAISSGGRGEHTSKADFLPNCAAGLVLAQKRAPALRPYELALGEAEAIDGGRYRRVQCALSGSGGRQGVVTVDISCGSVNATECTSVVSAAANGKVLLVPKP